MCSLIGPTHPGYAAGAAWMRWTNEGAHQLLQVRVQVLNDELRQTFCRWYPGVEPRQSLQQQQGHVVLLLPSLTGKALQFTKQEADERWRIGMRFEQLLQAWEAEHFTAGAMRLPQAIAVQEQALSRGAGSFLLL